ncbi:MAG: TonB-dependent receptor [Gammaproteobacteria bacterium]|nr:TonB-dependent receptor [Gammaproteobacteria bacterium]
MNKRIVGSVVSAAMGLSGLALASDEPIETVHIIGSKDDASRLAGSGSVLDQDDLQKFEYTDIHRILSQVPGVYTRDEEGYGLRPNISIRGTYGDRSSKLTLMEDGVLIAPAPYTASSAYYFPTMGRIAGVEVLKGAAAIENGPYTVGGALNLISTPIPQEMSGQVTAEMGEDRTYRLHASYGGSTAHWGFLLEGHTHSSDGFSRIDNSSNDTGFEKDDLLTKLRYNTGARGHFYQQLELKLQYSEETSEQTYVGLAEADFKGQPYRRYGLSQEDVMDNEHKSATLTHVIEFNETVSLTTTAYYNDFSRNWYKVDKIDGEGIDEVITCANGGDCAGMSSVYGAYDQAFANRVLHGEAFADVSLKNNNRDYESRGVQTRLAAELEAGNWAHALLAGVRYHEDEEVRQQPVDLFLQGDDGSFELAKAGSAGRSAKESEAWSLFLTDTMSWNSWAFKPGLRYENYEINGVQNSELLPGLGLTRDLEGDWQVLAGIYQGHSPSASGDSNPETPTNYEAGLRFRSSSINLELIGFFSDYDNIIGICTNSGGAGSEPCEAGDTENGGKAEVKGLEAQASYALVVGSVQLPLALAYTYTHAEFKSSFIGQSVWGDVHKGDNLPNLPEHQLMLNAGLVLNNGVGGNLRLSWYDDTCATAACAEFEEVDAFYSLDLSAYYDWNPRTRFYVNMDNLTDNDGDIVSRQPKAGARGQKPRTLLAGVRYQF